MRQPIKLKCQCNCESVDHEAGKCKNPPAYVIRRNTERLLVCCDCRLTSDKIDGEL